MRVDVHTHIFTLRSILSREAIRVFTQRLERYCPPFLAEAIGDLLYDQLDKPEYLDERRLLRALVQKLTGVQTFNDLIGQHFLGDLLSVQVEGDLDALTVEALSDIITRVADVYQGGGVPGKVLNVIETLRASMQPTITDVADDILQHMDDDGVIGALMLDIFVAPESDRDRKTYLGQIAGTAEAALQRPGRILPFFGVHPDRPRHLEELKKAIEHKGFVGVKLYPSLGYTVGSPEMRRVYQYCMEADLPVLLHCGHGGFYREKRLIDHCDPDQWTSVLADSEFAGLRVCFAHFGGWEALGKRHCLGENWDPQIDVDENWGRKIYDFMLLYPNVYTDLAKHVGMFEDAQHEQVYFDTMRELIADPKIGKRILFGTDAWLLRLDMPVKPYWDKWKAGAGQALDEITIEGPRSFLGFPDAGGGEMAGNLKRYVEHMERNRHRVGGPPAPWLEQEIGLPFSLDRDPPNWDFRKLAVRDTYQFLGAYLTDRQAERGYRPNRLIHLKQLPYFDPDDPNFAGRCRDMARRFIDFADQNLTYTEGHSFGSAVDLFVGIFKRGDLRFCDVAMALNTVIDYPEPIS